MAGWAGTLEDWRSELERLKQVIGPALGRSEARVSAGLFSDGLLSAAERKTGLMMAEAVGLDRPYRVQSLLGRSSGTAGRIENCQVGVFACDASRYGYVLMDQQLYLPKTWAEDSARCAKARVSDDATFATKPAMARVMIARALDADVACAWVPADAVYMGRTSNCGGCWKGADSPPFWRFGRIMPCASLKTGPWFRPTRRPWPLPRVDGARSVIVRGKGNPASSCS
ncbi:transposase [Rhodospira trueperi]|uniref:DDE superfamily endonuclease n=1 Tax=Rhodospira trueperi TaxID=69960 RepID=A0A1G7HS78_9PROT|nr:transposase [Rhodospira trueperi]SDF03351.1 DDE superfamily endonuclease [Rhodospira trueperi]